MGNINFDKELRLRKGLEQYRRDKSKAGRSGSSAGKPRPYAKQNMAYARLFSPLMVGHSMTVTPKHNYLSYRVGQYYEWYIIEEGLGTILGRELEANEIKEHFKVIPKKK